MVEDPNLPQTSTESRRKRLSEGEHREVPHLQLFARNHVSDVVPYRPKPFSRDDKLDDSRWLAASISLAFYDQWYLHFRHRVQNTLEHL
jgi:hypothetical protein